MQQKMRSTVIKLRNSQYIQFIKVISSTKFGYNGLFSLVQSKSIIESYNSNGKNANNLLIKQKTTTNNNNRFFDVYAFSKSLLQINNLNSQIQDLITQYTSLNSKLLSPIIDRIQDKDIFYIVSQVHRYSLKELVQLRQGLTQYQVIYFAMQLFQLFNYYKSRQVYLEKIQLNNLYLNNDMKIIMPFSIFINKIHKTPILKRLPFRNQIKNLNNCPDIVYSMNNKNNFKKNDKNQNNINIHLINSWNIGILIYELFQNIKPFSLNCDLVAQQQNSNTKYDNNQIINKKIYQLKFYQNNSYEAQDLITKLLQIDSKKRLNIPLMIIQPLFKKNKQIPHVLPSTILTCPPSQQFKKCFKQQFQNKRSNLKSSQSTDKFKQIQSSKISNKNAQLRGFKKSQSSKILQYNHVRTIIKQQQQYKKQEDNIQVQSQSQNSPSIIQQQFSPSIISPKLFTPIYQTQKYIKDQQRNLSQNKIFIQQFTDISHIYGYGYQMNTGMLCFVFNDQTEFYYPNSNRKMLVYVNQKKIRITYSSDKLPEQDQIKKKIYILEGYSKTIKKYKNQSSNNQKVVSVLKYTKTRHASIFYLSNDTIQLFFNDKISFIMTKNMLYILGKNNDKYQKFDYKNQTSELKTRRTYLMSMAQKIFGWKKDKLLDQDIFENISNQQENKKNSIIKDNQIKIKNQNHKIKLLINSNQDENNLINQNKQEIINNTNKYNRSKQKRKTNLKKLKFTHKKLSTKQNQIQNNSIVNQPFQTEILIKQQ